MYGATVKMMLQEHLFANHPDLSIMSIFAEATVNAAKDPTTFHIINNTVASKYPLLSWSPVIHMCCSTPW
jgi:hypothetical protein